MKPTEMDTQSVNTALATAAPDAATVFGRVLTVMVSPFDGDQRLDRAGAEQLAAWLVRDGGNDGVVVNGTTTGESYSTDDREKRWTVEAAHRAVAGTGRTVIAGVGSASTAHSVALAEQAADAGADGLLVGVPYFSRPTQAELLQHFRDVADATPLPVMLYDAPQRTGVEIAPETLVAAAEHPRILAVKDASGDLAAAAEVMGRTSLAYYSGEDALNLPWLSVGATGVVSVVGQVAGNRLQDLVRLHTEGRDAEAEALHRELLPIYQGTFHAPGVASAKASVQAVGRSGGPFRLPLVSLTAEECQGLRADLPATADQATAGRRPSEDAAHEPAAELVAAGGGAVS